MKNLRDLGLLAIGEYVRLNSGVLEIKRMLAKLMQKVQGERLQAEC